MHNTVAVKVLYRDSNLVRQFFDPSFTQFEVSELDVVEQVLALHVLQHYVVVVGVLE